MNNKAKKYAAVFLFALFVFPFVQKGIHDFAHINDFHCSSKAARHFHPIEHHCSICDEVFSISDGPKYFSVFSPLFTTSSTIQLVDTCEFSGQKILFFSLRAPPTA